MKKKILIMLFAAMLSISSIGCGATETKSDDTSDKQLEQLQKENEELKKQLEKENVATNTPAMSSDFKKGTTKVTHGEFTVDIPANWISKNIEGEDGLYFYPTENNTALLMLTYTPVPELQSASDEQISKNMDGWVSGLKDGTGVISIDSVNDSQYNGTNVKLVTMTQKIDISDENFKVSAIGFIANNGLGQIFMAVVNNNNIDYSDDFESILNSLTISEPETNNPEKIESATQKNNNEEAPPSVTVYGPGILKVGYDMPAGEYIVMPSNRSSGYFSVNSDANGDDILFNDNFKYNSIITVYDEEYLELSSAVAYPFDEWCSQNTLDTSKEGSMLKIGVNLPAGEYKLNATSDRGGYYCIYSDSRQQDILSNDNFEGQAYINVSDGQYLVLSNCIIEQ